MLFLSQPKRERLDLKRLPGEEDGPYRQRLIEVIAHNSPEGVLSIVEVTGACLDSFAGSVSHAEFIGWGAGAGTPSAYHVRNSCTCPPHIIQLNKSRKDALAAIRRAKWELEYAQRQIKEKTEELADIEKALKDAGLPVPAISQEPGTACA